MNEALKGYATITRINPVKHFTESEKEYLVGRDVLYFYDWKCGIITNEGFIPIGNPIEVWMRSHYIYMRFSITHPTLRLDAYGMWVEDSDGVVRSVKPFSHNVQMSKEDTFKLVYNLELDIFRQLGMKIALKETSESQP